MLAKHSNIYQLHLGIRIRSDINKIKTTVGLRYNILSALKRDKK